MYVSKATPSVGATAATAAGVVVEFDTPVMSGTPMDGEYVVGVRMCVCVCVTYVCECDCVAYMYIHTYVNTVKVA